MATKTATPADDVAAKLIAGTEDFTTKLSEFVAQTADNQKQQALEAVAAYEHAVLASVDSYEKAVADTNIDWLKEIVTPQAASTRELTTANATAVRKLVG
jgi:hypothetical protein